MAVVDDIRWIAAECRRRGEVVEFVPGWEERGAGAMVRVDGQLNHHDAVPPSAGHAGGLRVCTFGRAGLRNSLCMFYVASNGAIWVVAAGVSWHAGEGRIASNPRWSGIEARNDGRGEPWPPAQLRAHRTLNVVSAERWRYGVANVRDHKEHAPGRKSDRAGIDPAAWRRSLTASPSTPQEAIAMGKYVAAHLLPGTVQPFPNGRWPFAALTADGRLDFHNVPVVGAVFMGDRSSEADQPMIDFVWRVDALGKLSGYLLLAEDGGTFAFGSGTPVGHMAPG